METKSKSLTLQEKQSSAETLNKYEQSVQPKPKTQTGHKKKHAPDVPKKETKMDDVKVIEEPLYASVIPKEKRKQSIPTSHVKSNNDNENSTPQLLTIRYKRKSSSSSSSSDSDTKEFEVITDTPRNKQKAHNEKPYISTRHDYIKSHESNPNNTIQASLHTHPIQQKETDSLKKEGRFESIYPHIKQDNPSTHSYTIVTPVGVEKQNEPEKFSKPSSRSLRKLNPPKKSKRETIMNFVRRKNKPHKHTDSSNSSRDGSDKEHSRQNENLLKTKEEIENKKGFEYQLSGSKDNLYNDREKKSKNTTAKTDDLVIPNKQKISEPKAVLTKDLTIPAVSTTVSHTSNTTSKHESSKSVADKRKLITKRSSSSSSISDDAAGIKFKKLDSPKLKVKVLTFGKFKQPERKSIPSEKVSSLNTPFRSMEKDVKSENGNKPTTKNVPTVMTVESKPKDNKYDTNITTNAKEKLHNSSSESSSDIELKHFEKDTSNFKFSSAQSEYIAKKSDIPINTKNDNDKNSKIILDIAEQFPKTNPSSLTKSDSSSSESSKKLKVHKKSEVNKAKDTTSNKTTSKENNILLEQKTGKLEAESKKMGHGEEPVIQPFKIVKPQIVRDKSSSSSSDSENNSRNKNSTTISKGDERNNVSYNYIKTKPYAKENTKINAKVNSDLKVNKISKPKHNTESSDNNSDKEKDKRKYSTTGGQHKEKHKFNILSKGSKRRADAKISSDSSSESDVEKLSISLEVHKKESNDMESDFKSKKKDKRDELVKSNKASRNILEGPKQALKEIEKFIHSSATSVETKVKRHSKTSPSHSSESSSDDEIIKKPAVPEKPKHLFGELNKYDSSSDLNIINTPKKDIDKKYSSKPVLSVTQKSPNINDINITSSKDAAFSKPKSENHSLLFFEKHSSDSSSDSEGSKKKTHETVSKILSSDPILNTHTEARSKEISFQIVEDNSGLKHDITLNTDVSYTQLPEQTQESKSKIDVSLKNKISASSKSSESSSDEEKKKKLLSNNKKLTNNKKIDADSMMAVSKVIESYKKSNILESNKNSTHEESVKISLSHSSIIPKQASKSIEIKPYWIDERFISIALKYHLGPYENIKSLQVVPAVSVGENYSSDVFRGTVKTDSRTIHIIFKCIPQGELRAAFFKQANLCTRESTVYNHALPLLKGQSDTPKYPRCYHTLQDNIRDTLVLEDLEPLGYKTSPRQKGLDVAHCRLALTELAHLHGFSAALRKLNPKKFHNEILNKYSEIIYTDAHEAFFGPYFTNIFTGIVAAIRENLPMRYHIAADMLQTIIPRIYSLLKKSVNYKNGVIVFHHGDFWNNNILFRYAKGNNHPLACSLIDFQLSRVASPVLELLYFFYTSTEQNVRRESEEELLQMYLNEVHWAMHQRGVENPQGVFYTSMEELRNEMRKFAIFGFLTACALMPIVVTSEENVPDMNEYTVENFLNTNPLEKMIKSSIFKRRMKHVIEDFDDMGLFFDIKNNKIF